MRALRTLLLGLALTRLAACSALGPAESALEEGRLPVAAAELRRLEPAARSWSGRARARYALYRGLAELGLGNAVEADRWLYLAWGADRKDPRAFDELEHGALMAAWRSTGRLPGEPGRPDP
jgi:hypothetical protein